MKLKYCVRIFPDDFPQDFLREFFFRYGRGDDEGYGILKNDFETIRDSWRLEELQEIMPILS